MALTNEQLQTRIEAIEETLNTVQTALNNLASKAQLKSLLSIRQAEIEQLKTDVASLKSQVSTLQEIVADLQE